MKNSILDEIAYVYQLKSTGTMVVDILDYIPITLQLENSNFMKVTFLLDGTVYEQNKEEMKKALKTFRGTSIKYYRGYATLLIGIRKYKVETYEQVRDFIRFYAKTNQESLICPICGEKNCDTFAVHNNRYVQTHAKCLAKVEQESVQRLETGNYLTGFIGAFLGSLAVLAISLLLISFTDTSFGWLYLISPIVASMGYLHFKGPYHWIGTMIIILCSVAAFIVFHYALVLIMLNSIGVYFDVNDFMNEFIDLNRIVFSVEYIKNCWFEFVFFIIGMGALLYLRPLSKKRMEETEEELKSLRTPMVLNEYLQNQ